MKKMEVTTHGDVWLVVCENPHEDYTLGVFRSVEDAMTAVRNDFAVHWPNDESILWEMSDEPTEPHVGWISGGGAYSITPHDILGFAQYCANMAKPKPPAT
jgi:hypothetical protein